MRESQEVVEHVNSTLSKDPETVAVRQLNGGAQGELKADQHQKKLRKLVFAVPLGHVASECCLEDRQSRNGVGSIRERPLAQSTAMRTSFSSSWTDLRALATSQPPLTDPCLEAVCFSNRGTGCQHDAVLLHHLFLLPVETFRRPSSEACWHCKWALLIRGKSEKGRDNLDSSVGTC